MSMPILKIPIFFHTGYFKILKSQDLHAKYRNLRFDIIKLKDLTGRTIESWIFCMWKYSKFKTWFCMQNIWIPRCNMLNIKISDLTCRISKYQGLALTMKTSSFNCSNIWHDEYWNIFSRISVNILQKNIFPASRGCLSRRGKKEAFLPRRERPLQTGKKYSAYSSYQFSDYA